MRCASGSSRGPIAALPLWAWLARRWNKRLAYIAGIAFWAAVQLVMVNLGPADALGWLLTLCVLAGSGVSAAHVLPWAILPDAIEWDEWQTGTRHEGLFFSLITLMQKVACVFLAIRYVFSKERMVWPERLSEMMNLTTGAGYTPEEIMKAAERVYNLERMFLIKAGSDPENDTLPHRMLHEPLPDGPAKGRVVELDRMLQEFYKLRGWDETGHPTKEKLQELGLPF